MVSLASVVWFIEATRREHNSERVTRRRRRLVIIAGVIGLCWRVRGLASEF